MPEALAAVQTVNLPSGNTSKMEHTSTAAEGTDGSTASRCDDRQVAVTKSKFLYGESQGKPKYRKSHENKILQKIQVQSLTSMTIENELQESLSMEQRTIQTLENQKNELINEICELKNEAKQKEEDLGKEIQVKIKECSELNNKLNDAEDQIKAQKLHELYLRRVDLALVVLCMFTLCFCYL